jgi:ABC-type sugar transport system permease subunit
VSVDQRNHNQGGWSLTNVPYIWFLLPGLLAYTVLFIYPTIRSFYLSLYDWSGRGPLGPLVWEQNFRDIIHSDKFWQAAGNSFRLFLFIFIFQNTVSLGLAILLNRPGPATHLFRVIIFLPQIMSAVATGIIWIMMLDPIIGAVNPFLGNIGLGDWQRQWQSDPDWALRTVMIVMAWQWNGMAVILYLAGLQNVPDDLRHAAMIDGAGRFRTFRDITFPMLAPAFTIVTVLSFILIFRAFDLVYILGGPAGVPDGHTLVLGVLIYSDAFGQGAFNSQARFSFAMAEGVTLFLFLAAMSGLLIWLLGRRETAVQT